MFLSNPLILLAMLFALLGLISLIITVGRIGRWKLFSGFTSFVTALLMLSLSALFGRSLRVQIAMLVIGRNFMDAKPFSSFFASRVG